MKLPAMVVAAMLATAAAGAAQEPAKVPRIGYLGINRSQDVQPLLDEFVAGLREHGWVDGRNVVIDYRWAEGKSERFDRFASELVARNVKVIVVASMQATQAASNATRTIPIVMVAGVDPVAEGFVSTLGRPGGNITGLTTEPGPEIAGKQLQLLIEAVHPARVAVLSNPVNPSHPVILKTLKSTVQTSAVQLDVVEAANPGGLDAAMAAAAGTRANAVLLLADSMFYGQRHRLAALSEKHRMPLMSNRSEYADAGVLMSYGSRLAENFRRAAIFVDRILKGGKPADLPIEQPTKFELVVNLKTAKALGLAVPQSVVLRADRVIQ